jgi:hypothetical protein
VIATATLRSSPGSVLENERAGNEIKPPHSTGVTSGESMAIARSAPLTWAQFLIGSSGRPDLAIGS